MGILELLCLQLIAPFLGNLARELIYFGGVEHIASARHFVKAKHLNRRAGAGLGNAPALIVHHCAHAAVCHAGNYRIANLQRAVLHKHGCYRAAALVKLGFYYYALSHAVGIRLKLKHVRLEQYHFKQIIQAFLGFGRNGNAYCVTAPFFADQTVFGKLLLYPVRIGGGLIHFVYCNNYGHACGLGMVYGLNGLRHYAVVRRNDQYYYVRNLRSAGAHSCECLVTRGIDKGYLPAVAGDGICADVLRYAAGFAFGNAAVADSIEQAGLAVVNVAHYGYYRRALNKVFILVLVHTFKQNVLIGLGNVLFKLNAVVRCYQRAGIEIYLLIYGGHYA